jgi:hypothetical protein
MVLEFPRKEEEAPKSRVQSPHFPHWSRRRREQRGLLLGLKGDGTLVHLQQDVAEGDEISGDLQESAPLPGGGEVRGRNSQWLTQQV